MIKRWIGYLWWVTGLVAGITVGVCIGGALWDR